MCVGGGGGGGTHNGIQTTSALEKFMYFSSVAEALRCHKPERYQTENRARTLRDHWNPTDGVE